MSIGRTCGKARRRGEHSHAARSGRRGNQWQSVVVINCRTSVVISGNQWSSVVVINCRTSVVISGNQWSSVVVINCRTSVVRRPSWRTPRTPMRRSVSHLMREAIRAHQTSSKVIRGHHQRHSEVIKRHQRSSEAIISGTLKSSVAISRHPGASRTRAA